MRLRRGHLSLVVLCWLNAPAALAADWLLVHEVTRAQVNLYQQESRYYIDRTSLTSGTVEGVRYETAMLQTKAPGKPDSVDQIAVICDKSTLALALSVRKMGSVQPNGAITFVPDFGAPKSLSDFQLTNIDRKVPNGLFTLAALAVCKYRQP